AVSHTFTRAIRSAEAPAAARRSPLGLNAILKVERTSWGALRLRGGALVRTSQSRTAPLQVAEARYRPSGLYATLQTSESCSRVRTPRASSPFNGVASQIWTAPSALPEARRSSGPGARQ